MGKKPQISSPKRWSIVRHKKNGFTDRRTAKILKISPKAVNTTWKIFKETGDIKPRKRSGRPKR
jgi:transposase